MWNKEKKTPVFLKFGQWCIRKVLLETNGLLEDCLFHSCFLNTRFPLHLCQIVCLKENSYWMKTTYPMNLFWHGGYFYDRKDVDIHVSNICTQLKLKIPTTIVFNQFLQIFTKKIWHNSLDLEIMIL